MLLSLLPLFLHRISCSYSVTVKIGLVTAIDPLPDQLEIFKAAYNELKRDGIIDNDTEFEIYFRESATCQNFSSINDAAELYYVHGVRVFIGPLCSFHMRVIGKMFAEWNALSIGFGSSANDLSNKKVYRTLARVTVTSTNAIANNYVALIKHFGWKKVAIVGVDMGLYLVQRRMDALRVAFQANDIKITADILFENGSDADTMEHSGYLKTIRNNARIIVGIFGYKLYNANQFMKAVRLAGMKTAEYVYILLWISHDRNDHPPWFTDNGHLLSSVKKDYDNTLILDNIAFAGSQANSFFDKFYTLTNLTDFDLNMYFFVVYLQLYDALKFFALTLRKAIERTGNDTIYVDGKYMWNLMRSTSFEGMTGTVVLDDRAERLALYTGFFVSPGDVNLSKVVDILPFRLENCDGLVNETGCFYLSVRNSNTTAYWPMVGFVPGDEPICGFSDKNCSWTKHILYGIAIVLLVSFIGLSYIIYGR